LLIFIYQPHHRGEKGRGEKGRGEKGEFLCPLSWSVHNKNNFARDGYIEFTVFLCPSKILRHGNKNNLSLVMVCSALINSVFKAFHLFLNKYI
jgi:hypothetical protein